MCVFVHLSMCSCVCVCFDPQSQHCTPEARLMHSGQQGAVSALGQQASLYSALARMGQSKRPMPELLPSSWLPIVNALKEAQLANEEADHAHQ